MRRRRGMGAAPRLAAKLLAGVAASFSQSI